MERKSIKHIKSTFFVSLAFAFIELFGGAITNSVSILIDSFRNFGDVISIGIALVLEKYAQKRPNKKYTYGYARFSVIGSLVSTIFLLISSGIALFIIVPRIYRPETVNHEGMFLLAAIGLIISGISNYATTKGQGISEQVVSLHQFEDLFSWVGVLITSVVMSIYDLSILDPILSILITLIVVRNALGHIKTIINIFLEKVPDDIDLKEVEKEILENDKINEVEYFHIWSLDGVKDYASMNIILDKTLSLKEAIKIKEEVKEKVHEFGVTYSTIEIKLK